MNTFVKSALAAAFVLSAAAAPAFAHGGGDDDAGRARFEVKESEAIEIAVEEGLADVREVKARRGVWKIEGTDKDGVKIEIEIDGNTGEVVKVERYPR